MKKISLLLALVVLMSFVSCNISNSSESNIEESSQIQTDDFSSDTPSYILNKNTKKFHYPKCYTVNLMNEENKISFVGNREAVINQGYKPCLKCNP